MAKKIKTLHIITGLHTGGAEMMLSKLLMHMDRDAFKSEVISLTDIGSVGKMIQQAGIHVESLNMKSGIPDPRFLFRLAKRVREKKPDVVQTWLYHADLLGGLAAFMAGNKNIAWGIRQSNLQSDVNKKKTLWTARICANLSGSIPQLIICGSEAALASHAAFGYDRTRMCVIPNGFEVDRFAPDPASRRRIRQEYGIQSSDFVIGHVARYDPQKDHRNLICAAEILIKLIENERGTAKGILFLLIGEGIDQNNSFLVQEITRRGLTDHIQMLGKRDDIPQLTTAFDIATSSSLGEGFPNVIGESMACGVPCVVTDVGDSALLVGETGLIVPPKNPEALAAAWGRLFRMSTANREALGSAARKRIQDTFDIRVIARQYETTYDRMLGQ